MPMIQEQKFRRKDEYKTRDIVPVPFDKSFTREQLENDKLLLQQTKDATAIKQLAKIGSIVLHEKKTAKILDIIMNNKRKNKRLGVPNFD